MKKLRFGIVAALLMLSVSVSAGNTPAKTEGPGPTTPKTATDDAVSGIMFLSPFAWALGAVYYTIKYGYYK